MIAPDPANRQDCCGAPEPNHWDDCPEWVLRRRIWHRRENITVATAADRKISG